MGDDTPREMTDEEISDEFLRNVTGIARYWANESRKAGTADACLGTMFSLLVLLDGGSGSSPGFHVVPHTHESDQKFCKDSGENWYPHQEEEMGKIRGKLHDHAISLHEAWSGKYEQGRVLIDLDPMLQAKRTLAGRLREILYRCESGRLDEVRRLVRNLFDLLKVTP